MSLSIFAAAAETPGHPAAITDRAVLSYADLAGRVRGAIARLRDRSLQGAGPVGLVAANDLPTLETVHALIATGTPASSAYELLVTFTQLIAPVSGQASVADVE